MAIFLLAALTMVAFAANSLLNRLALTESATDWTAYTFVRIASGAIMLIAFLAWRSWRASQVDRAAPAQGLSLRPPGSFASAIALVAYAAAFSYAYLSLETGMGALILFSLVQASMIAWGLVSGERPSGLEWTGMVAAFGGFIWLVSPGLSAPDPLGAALMALAGVAWGVYTLRGKGAADPLGLTAGNFLRAAPLALVPLLFAAVAGSWNIDGYGIFLGILSGAITSGLGYALWYRTLRHFTATQAAILQLTVPVIAAAMGLSFAGEEPTLRLMAASAIILGGVAIAILARRPQT